MRGLVFGFDYGPYSPGVAIDALRSGGASHIAWLLHQEKVGEFAPILGAHGITIHTTKPPLGLANQPPAIPEAELDLRFLMDREMHSDHEWGRTLELEQLRCHVYALLCDEDPDVVVFSDVPHGAASYLLYRLARAAGIRTVVIKYGPTPFHVNYVEDIDIRLIDSIRTDSSSQPQLSESSERYLEQLRMDYVQAEPAYSRDSSSIAARARKKLRAGSIPLDPRLYRSVVEREQLRRSYERRALTSLPSTKDERTAAVFLHLQPERTTTPEGGVFAQQWLVVAALRSVLPNDWQILVREHPATFVRGARLVADPHLYSYMLALPNVSLVSTSIPPFEVVDSATITATVTGTVAFESAVRGTPCVVFGNAPYLGCSGIIDGRTAAIDGLASADRSTLPGLSPANFLAAFDSSERSWVAPWSSRVDAREMRQRGDGFEALLPRALAG